MLVCVHVCVGVFVRLWVCVFEGGDEIECSCVRKSVCVAMHLSLCMCMCA